MFCALWCALTRRAPNRSCFDKDFAKVTQQERFGKHFIMSGLVVGSNRAIHGRSVNTPQSQYAVALLRRRAAENLVALVLLSPLSYGQDFHHHVGKADYLAVLIKVVVLADSTGPGDCV